MTSLYGFGRWLGVSCLVFVIVLSLAGTVQAQQTFMVSVSGVELCPDLPNKADVTRFRVKDPDLQITIDFDPIPNPPTVQVIITDPNNTILVVSPLTLDGFAYPKSAFSGEFTVDVFDPVNPQDFLVWRGKYNIDRRSGLLRNASGNFHEGSASIDGCFAYGTIRTGKPVP